MSPVRRIVCGLATLMGLAFPVPTHALPPQIRDDGKFFSADAVKRANERIREIARKYDKDLLVETFATVPDDQVEKVKAMSADERTAFVKNWALERAQQTAVKGVYILACQQPDWVYFTVTAETRARFSDAAVKKLGARLLEEFRAGRYDEGLEAAVQIVEAELSQDVRRPAGAEPAFELVVQTGHTGGVTSVVLSPDGKQVLTGSVDNTAVLWSVASGAMLRTFQGHTDSVTSVAFSPDGKQVLTGSMDKTAVLWSTASGEKLRTFQGHTQWVNCVAFSPDGKQVLTGSWDGAALWSVATGAKLRTFDGKPGYSYHVLSVAFSPDGKQVLTGARDNTAVLWSAASGEKLRIFEGLINDINSMAFSPDGKQVVTPVSNDNTVVLWSAVSGQKLRTFRGHIHSISVAFSPDGKQVLTGLKDGAAVLWSTTSGEKLRTFQGHTSWVTFVAFSPDGKQVLTGSADRTAVLWSVASGEKLRIFQGHTGAVGSVAFSPDGKQVLTGSGDKTAVLWSVATGATLRTFQGHTGGVGCVAFSPDGKQVLTGSGDKTAVLWSVASGQKLRTFQGHTASVKSVAFSPDGKQVLTGSGDKTAVLWSTGSGEKLRTFQGHTEWVSSVAFSPDGKQVLTGSWDKTAVLWSAASGEKLRTFQGHTAAVWSVAFSPDGMQVLTGSWDKTAVLWSTGSGEKLRTFQGHTGGVRSVAFSPNGKQVLTGSDDHTAKLWSAISGVALRTLQEHTSAVFSVAIGSDGKQVLTGSWDGTARLWNAATGQEICSFISIDAGAEWLVVTPDGLFDSSFNGSRFVSYRTRGTNTLVPLENFQKQYYRPGLLSALMRGERPEPNVAVAQAVPPKVRIVSPSRSGMEVRTTKVDVEAAAEAIADNPVTELRLLINGRPYQGDEGVRRIKPQQGEVRESWTVELPAGGHRLAVVAVGTLSQATSEEVEVLVAPPGNSARPPAATLHLLAIGINTYPGTMKLDCAAPDARAMDETFRKHSRNLYKVQGTLVLDNDATRVSILKGLDALAKQARPGDLAVIFYAGHGYAERGAGFLLIPVDVDRQRFAQTGITGEELRTRLAKLPCTVLLIMDCCYAGSIDAGPKKGALPAETDAFLRNLKSDNQGVVVMCGASKDQQSGEEARLGHGYFTQALTEGLSGKAVSKRDGLVSLTGLQFYVEERVRELSKDEQLPTIGKPSTIGSFPLTKP